MMATVSLTFWTTHLNNEFLEPTNTCGSKFLRNFKERGEDADVDCGVSLRVCRHHQKGGAASTETFTNFYKFSAFHFSRRCSFYKHLRDMNQICWRMKATTNWIYLVNLGHG